MSDAVYQMFRGIAPRYDLANDVLSMGLHRMWRRRAVQVGGICRGWRVLDICSGTGDFSAAIARAVEPNGSVVAVDFVYEMLTRAKQKAGSSEAAQIRGDAMRLPFATGGFDAATIGFGIRNVDNPVGALSEIRRVLRPSGVLVVLEFGKPTLAGFSTVYRAYSRYLMPMIGGVLTGDRSAYQYLPETAAQFPDGPRFVELLRKASFDCTEMIPLLSGLAYIYVARAQRQSGEQQIPHDTACLAHSS